MGTRLVIVHVYVCCDMDGKDVRSVLERFAQHSKHREAQLSTINGIGSLLKKYVAVHMGGELTADQIYPYVSEDYGELALRTHNPRLDAYATTLNMDPGVFVFIMKHGATPKISEELDEAHMAAESIFQGFKCDLFPAGGEDWAVAAKADRWRDRGYFFATLCSRNKVGFRNLIRAVHNCDVKDVNGHAHQQEFERIHVKLRDFRILPVEDDLVAATAEIGTMISAFSFQPDALQELLDLETEHVVKPLTKAPVTEKQVTPPETVSIGADIGPDGRWNDAHFRNMPVVIAYKSAVGISRMFSTRKAMKQMLLGALALNESLYTLGPILGSRQRTLPDYARTAKYTPSQWAALISAVDHFSGIVPKTRMRSQQCLELCAVLGSGTNLRPLLKAALTVHGVADMAQVKARWNAVWPENQMTATMERDCSNYLKRNPKPDWEVAQAILDL